MRGRLFVLLLAAFVAACSPSNGSEKKAGGHPGMGMPPPEVTVITAAPQPLPQAYEYVGQTAGSREAEVRARVGGILVKRNFEEGKPVQKGQSTPSTARRSRPRSRARRPTSARPRRGCSSRSAMPRASSRSTPRRR
jgi:hypothetical protein